MNPKTQDEDVIASFTGYEMIPISWYFLFKPEDIRSRREEFPEQLSDFEDDDSLDSLEKFLEDPVAFKVSLPDAKARLAEYKEVFEQIPYIWSYFKVIDLIDKELENYIEQLESESTKPQIKRTGPHPTLKLSQVDTVSEIEEEQLNEFKQSLGHVEEEFENENQVTDDLSEDNPFADLEELGAALEQDLEETDIGESDKSIDETSFGDQLEDLSDDDLLSALEEAAEMDFSEEEQEEEEKTKKERITSKEEGLFMPVIVYFDEIASEGRGQRMGKIPLLLERLMHHAKREGELTRVMQDLMQEIFREALSGWRITGQLSEDFVQGDPEELSNIMLGEPSPYVIINDSLDLEYWTRGTLQSGDERLMYTLTRLPSEEIHIAIKAGKLGDVAPKVGNLLVKTQSVTFPRLSVNLLKQPALESNIWGFRVLLRDVSGEYKAATLLISDPTTSWREEFEDRVNLPGVLEDWNVELPVRFEEFSDIDHYQIVFEGARDMDETFQGFVRWARRHHIMYMKSYGVNGTISKLKNMLEETEDKQFGQLIFDILTNLTELGFNSAMDALSDDDIVKKLPWLYS